MGPSQKWEEKKKKMGKNEERGEGSMVFDVGVWVREREYG